MTETLTGKQVLALVAQEEVPEIEYMNIEGEWRATNMFDWSVENMRCSTIPFRIKPTPQRRLSVTLASGEVVSWTEPVREALKLGQEYWFVEIDGTVTKGTWFPEDTNRLAFGNVHLTREAAQEHADAIRKINTQVVTC